MAVDPARLEVEQPREPAPVWPCVFFTYEDEIIGALYWDHEVPFGVFDDGTPAIGEPDMVNGWCLHLLTDGYGVDAWGEGGRPHELLRDAHDEIARRGVPAGLTYEQSLELLWKPFEPTGLGHDEEGTP